MLQKKFKIVLIVLTTWLFLYGLIYLSFRYSHVEVWGRNGQKYVIFPKDVRWIYLFLRPAAYADGLITGMQFHIGPHE